MPVMTILCTCIFQEGHKKILVDFKRQTLHEPNQYQDNIKAKDNEEHL